MSRFDLSTIGIVLLVLIPGVLLKDTQYFSWYLLGIVALLTGLVFASLMSIRVVVTRFQSEAEKIHEKFSGITEREP